MTLLARYRPGDTGGYTFSRASAAYQRGPTGTWTSAGIDVLRDRHYFNGIRTTRLENARTNFLLNSGAPATQSVSLAAGTYTCWLEGSGSVVLSGGPTGTVTAGWATGQWVSFSLGGTTSVTFTVSGTVTLFQCEGPIAGSPTSYIPTSGTAVTRAADVLTYPIPSIVQPVTVFVDGHELGAQGATYARYFHIGNTANEAPYFLGGAGSNPSQAITRHHNGTTFSDSPNNDIDNTDIILNPTDHTEVRFFLNVDGSHGLASSLSGAAENAPSIGTVIAPAANWSTPTLFHVCGLAAAATSQTPISLVGIALATGVQDRTVMRSFLQGSYVSGDRVRETTTTTGTGNITLAGAVSGFQAFSAIATNADNVTYVIIGTTEWEVGISTYSGGTVLPRSTVLASSNAGALVNFSAGTKDVFCTLPAMQGLLPLARQTQVTDVLVPSKSSTYVNDLYELATGKSLELGPGAAMEVG